MPNAVNLRNREERAEKVQLGCEDETITGAKLSGASEMRIHLSRLPGGLACAILLLSGRPYELRPVLLQSLGNLVDLCQHHWKAPLACGAAPPVMSQRFAELDDLDKAYGQLPYLPHFQHNRRLNLFQLACHDGQM